MVSRLICGGLIGFAVLAASVSAQTVLYVDANATDPPDGLSWCTAYRTLDEALAVAGADTVIRVADGTYMPDTSGLADPREATFQLLNDVTIEGGYAGCAAPDPDARDVAVYQTRLDGNIGSPWTSADNCYHVVTASGTDATAILDGVTIAAGNANGTSPHDKGAGILNEGGSPTLTRCTFTHNTAVYAGGGMHNYAGLPTLSDCTFDQNTCEHVGGGMNNSAGSDVTLVNCTFRGNGATDNGGAMHNWESSPTLVNCTLGGNWVTIWPDYVGGIFNHASSPTLTNCILWANSGTQMNGSATATWSCIQDGWEGATNTDQDPAFVRNPSPGSDQEWGTFGDDYGDLHLPPGSPCVNAGDPNGDYTGQSDMDGEPRVLDGRVDMGADEYSGAAWLVASDPPDGGTLPKTQANVIRLTFSWAIVLPTSPALQIEPIGGGADVGDQFDYSLETTSVADDSLKAVEVGSVLANLTWYRVTPAAGLDVEPFALDLCVLIGDANGSGRITTADYAEIKEHMGEYTDARYDLNGSGRVTTADYSVVKANMGDRTPTKP